MKNIILTIGFLICTLPYVYSQSCISGDRSKATILFYESEEQQSTDSLFTVGSNTKVIFKSGNLLYQPGTGTYKIAEEQYDYVGGNGIASVNDEVYNPTTELQNQGTLYYEDSNGNQKRCTNTRDSAESKTYMGWIDLHKFHVLDGAFHANSIVIDGKEYRTLTQDEYTYLFFSRPNAKSLRGRARIKLGNRGGNRNDSIINGFILLPDNWHPSILPGVEFESDALAINGNTYYTENIYTREEWKILEKQGAIFLPAGGSVDKDGKDTKKCNRSGFYWLTEAKVDKTHAITLEFGGYYYSGRPGDPVYFEKNKDERRLIRLVEIISE